MLIGRNDLFDRLDPEEFSQDGRINPLVIYFFIIRCVGQQESLIVRQEDLCQKAGAGAYIRYDCLRFQPAIGFEQLDYLNWVMWAIAYVILDPVGKTLGSFAILPAHLTDLTKLPN